MHTTDISFPSELIAKIVRCVEDAVGDDIRADIRQHDLQTRNSIPSRIWDLLNTNIIKALDDEDCTIAKFIVGHGKCWLYLKDQRSAFSPLCVKSALRNYVTAGARECICITSIC